MRISSLLLILAGATPLAAQTTVDTTGIGSLIDQAMNRSEVMQNLEYLADNIGPRLSTSPAMRRANDWTAGRFTAYGLTAHLESYEFGVPWTRGTATLRITSPFNREITATAGPGRREAAARRWPVRWCSPISRPRRASPSTRTR